MNNPGLYSSVYQLIREYAELVDTVLINLKSKTSQVNDPARQRLGELLINLAGETWDNLPIRMIALILRDKDRTRQQKWEKLGKALLSEQFDTSGIRELEELAVALEHEQAGAISKMRGSLR